MASMQHPDEADWRQPPLELVASSFLTGADGKPVQTVKPIERVARVFSGRPSLGDAGFIRTGGGVHKHQTLHDDPL